MTRLYSERDLPPDAWDDPTPTYRPNWRDRARWAREAAESDARAQEAPGQGLGAEETGEGL